MTRTGVSVGVTTLCCGACAQQRTSELFRRVECKPQLPLETADGATEGEGQREVHLTLKHDMCGYEGMAWVRAHQR
jgi:hypothetical protein